MAEGRKVVASNRRARHDYEVLDTFEAGIVLKGSEVKSLRAGQVQLKDAFASIERGELWLEHLHIAPYTHASVDAHDPERRRKLLLHRRELDKLIGAVECKGYTLVATALYWKRGRAKLEIALARGKQSHDKRATQKDQEWTRNKQRLLRGH